MAKVFYNKLIRDKIPEKMEKKDVDFEVRELIDDEEFQQELLKKVTEEAHALSMARTRDDLLDELVDVGEVLDALKHHMGISDGQLERARVDNQQRKGKFDKRLFLHWSSDSDGYVSNETPQGATK